MEDDLSLGKYIRRLREAKRMSLLDLSTKATVAYAHLSRIENESTIPNPETIVKICDVLDGDLTLMLHKANNLPVVILDRLMERDRAVKLQTLRRAISGEPDEANVEKAAARALERGNFNESEVQELQQAVEGLAGLKPHARRAVIQLISVLHEDEDEGAPG